MRLRLAVLLLSGAVALLGCGGPAESVWAPDSEVQRWSFKNEGPETVTLFTVKSTVNDAGRHSGLMISGEERILFDPAGTFRYPNAPERNDVHYGISDRVLAVYIDYHARETFNVYIQEVPVSAAVAQMLTEAVEAYGAVPKAQCTLSISRILSETPGFESIPVGYFPDSLFRAFGKLPGVTTRVISDDDADDNHGVLLVAASEAQAIRASAE